jgi:hypothetical protein
MWNDGGLWSGATVCEQRLCVRRDVVPDRVLRGGHLRGAWYHVALWHWRGSVWHLRHGESRQLQHGQLSVRHRRRVCRQPALRERKLRMRRDDVLEWVLLGWGLRHNDRREFMRAGRRGLHGLQCDGGQQLRKRHLPLRRRRGVRSRAAVFEQRVCV